MRILITTLGTRGDVQPYIALAAGLQQAGHDVLLATAENFASLAAEYHIPFLPLPADIQMLMQGHQGRELMQGGNNPLALVRNMQKILTPILDKAGRILWEASDGVDVIVSHFMSAFFTYSISEKRGIQYVHTLLQPVIESREAPSAMIPPLPVNIPLYNRLTASAARWLMWKMFEPHTNRLRREIMNLPAVGANDFYDPILKNKDVLMAYSSTVCPKPEEWPDNVHLTGYWTLHDVDHWTPDPALVDFLDKGDAPVYIGFGSMNTGDPRATTMTIFEALKRTGQRAIISAGWGGLHAEALPANVYQVGAVPHEWLFPRMSAVIHHGGAGTTAAALRAGVPSMVVPFLADQPFWGRTVNKLGVGPAPVAIKRLTADNLTAALTQMRDDPAMKSCAAAIGECLRAEDGVKNAIRIITRN